MSDLTDFSKCCIHTMTTKPWSIDTAIEKYSRAGIKGITVWRQWLEGSNPVQVGDNIRQAGLTTVSLCRGGFFPSVDKKQRQLAIDDNRRALDEAAAIGAPWVVLVCGAEAKQSLAESRQQIIGGIQEILEHAHQTGVRLAIEPLHPMYAGDRSAVNTLKQANDMCDAIADSHVGVAVDVYHLWWDPDLEEEIHRCGESGYLWAFHICDWRVPTLDMLNDRGLMGEGCIDIPQIRSWVEAAGFDGFNEVEIFSTRWWQADQDEYLEKIKQAYLAFS